MKNIFKKLFSKFLNKLKKEIEIEIKKEIALEISQAGKNKITLKINKDFTGTYWVSANNIYYNLTGNHLNQDMENGLIPKNNSMLDLHKLN